jgi:hypothetical protein
MSTKADLISAHKAMSAVLDAKFAKVQEWQAFRAIDKALIALIDSGFTPANQFVQKPVRQQGRRSAVRALSPTTQARNMAELVIREVGRPVPLSELYEKIAARGVTLGGKFPNRRLSAILGDTGTLVSTEQGWWIADTKQQAEKEQRQSEAPTRWGTVSGASYPDLAIRALVEAGVPLATPAIIDFIAKHRTLRDSGRKTVVNITSSFSHDERLQNLSYAGRRVWWLAGKPLPDETPDGLRVNGRMIPEPGEFDIPPRAA